MPTVGPLPYGPTVAPRVRAGRPPGRWGRARALGPGSAMWLRVSIQVEADSAPNALKSAVAMVDDVLRSASLDCDHGHLRVAPVEDGDRT